MFCNNDYRQDMPYGDIDINITNQNANLNTANAIAQNEEFMAPMSSGGTMMGPVVETPQNRVVHRNFVHNVPQV